MAKAAKKLVYGVGINDADYVLKVLETIGYTESGKPIQKLSWICPFYLKWKNMLERCYSEKYQQGHPTYIGCSVSAEWHLFSNFRVWMERQDWEGKQLDKDILFVGNKIYNPETCVFVSPKVNSFLRESKTTRGECPIGVNFDKSGGKFRAQCWDVVTGSQKNLGYYTNPEQAHQAWLAFKLSQAHILAAKQTDPRVAAALIDRYENYSNYFPQGA